MTRAFTITGARVTHHTAPLSVLESASHDDPESRLRELADRDRVTEVFRLQTCNRVEEYVVAETPTAGETALEDVGKGYDASHVVRTGHEESLRHLLRVAAGLESQIIGEDQVLGQLRSAYLTARDAGTVGPVFEAALLKAIHVGERARTETAINDGTVSLGAAAVQLAERDVGLSGRSTLLVGAGEMATAVARGLADTDIAELRVVNRSVDRARSLTADLDVPTRVGGLDSLATHVAATSVVVVATASPDPVIKPRHVEAAGETVLIDLGQPRNVAPVVADRPGITVYDLDSLEAVTAATHADRQAAAEAVEAIVEEEYELLIDQYKRRRADAVIRAMYQGAQRLKERELETTLGKLEQGSTLSDAQREAVEGLADAIVSKLLAVPTESLREAAAEDDWETIATAIQLFDPTLLEDAPPAELVALASDHEAAADVSDD